MCKEAVVPGGIKDFKNHFQQSHGVRLYVKSDVPYTCKEWKSETQYCNRQFYVFNNFQNHLLKNHPLPNIIQQPATSNPSACEPALIVHEGHQDTESIFQNLVGITNMVVFDKPATLEAVHSLTSEFISSVRCNVSIPEKYVIDFMNFTTNLISKIESYLWTVVRPAIEKMGINSNADSIVKMINSFSVGNIFTNTKDMSTQIAHMTMKTQTKIPVPVEVLLEQKVVKQIKKVYTRTGIIRKELNKFTRDTYQYISICDLLKLIMRNPDAMNIVENETASPEGFFSSFMDGEQYKTHYFFQENPNALRLTLNADEIEIVNNLSSRAGNQKITHFYVKIQNFKHSRDSTYSTNYLILSINSKILKKHGYEKVLRPLIDDLKTLERGIQMIFGEVIYDLKAVLCSFAGDTLAAHEIFGLLSPSASFFCRQCYITKEDMRHGSYGALFQLRSEDSHQRDVDNALKVRQLQEERHQQRSQVQRRRLNDKVS